MAGLRGVTGGRGLALDGGEEGLAGGGRPEEVLLGVRVRGPAEDEGGGGGGGGEEGFVDE